MKHAIVWGVIPFLLAGSLSRADTVEEGERKVLQQYDDMRAQVKTITETPLECDDVSGEGNTAASNPMLAQMEQTLASLSEIMKASGACSVIPGEAHSQVQEAYSDLGAIQIIREDIRKAPPEEKRALAFEAILPFVAASCGNLVPSQQSDIVKALTAKSCFEGGQKFDGALTSMAVAKQFQAEEHPEDTNRVNRLWLAQPEIAQAIGCAPTPGVKTCE